MTKQDAKELLQEAYDLYVDVVEDEEVFNIAGHSCPTCTLFVRDNFDESRAHAELSATMRRIKRDIERFEGRFERADDEAI